MTTLNMISSLIFQIVSLLIILYDKRVPPWIPAASALTLFIHQVLSALKRNKSQAGVTFSRQTDHGDVKTVNGKYNTVSDVKTVNGCGSSKHNTVLKTGRASSPINMVFELCGDAILMGLVTIQIAIMIGYLVFLDNDTLESDSAISGLKPDKASLNPDNFKASLNSDKASLNPNNAQLNPNNAQLSPDKASLHSTDDGGWTPRFLLFGHATFGIAGLFFMQQWEYYHNGKTLETKVEQHNDNGKTLETGVTVKRHNDSGKTADNGKNPTLETKNVPKPVPIYSIPRTVTKQYLQSLQWLPIVVLLALASPSVDMWLQTNSVMDFFFCSTYFFSIFPILDYLIPDSGRDLEDFLLTNCGLRYIRNNLSFVLLLWMIFTFSWMLFTFSKVVWQYYVSGFEDQDWFRQYVGGYIGGFEDQQRFRHIGGFEDQQRFRQCGLSYMSGFEDQYYNNIGDIKGGMQDSERQRRESQRRESQRKRRERKERR